MSQEPNPEVVTEIRYGKQGGWNRSDEFSNIDRSKSKFGQIYELFIQFCENTSLRGVPRIVRASDRRKRLLWLNFVTIFFIACIACLIIITNQYLQYDVIHQPKRIFDAPRAFPSLTICNLRPFKSSDVDRLIQQGAVPVQAYFDAIMKIASTLDKHYASQFTTLLSLESYLLNLPEGMDPNNLGHRLEQLVQTCVVLYQNGTSIRGTNCRKAGHWVKTLDRIYHNCYTYEVDAQIRAQTLSVEMVLYLDNIVEHTNCFDCQDRIRGSQLTGARLLLNPDSSYPRIVEEGINLMPGTLTDIHFMVREWSMMTPPYGRCSHEAPVEIGFGGQTYSYTEQACQQGAIQAMIAHRCGCLSYDMPVPSHLEVNASLLYCQFFELPVVNISTRFYTEIRRRYFTQQAMERFTTRMYCSTAITRNTLAAETGCRAPCIRYSYDTQISTAQWPTKRFITNFANSQLKRKKHAIKWQELHDNFKDHNAKGEEDDERRFVNLLRPYAEIHNMSISGREVEAVDFLMNLQDVEQNFLSIIVSRPNFDIIRVEEKAVVTLTSLFSQIGGLLSIWVGITMICIVEVAEFLLNCFDVLCGRTP
ncbi:FMRFamide-activated amiloride-sensitive sodium channel [Taenia crassiceps]|uniref:FMRFamide-activated amiloride-sensitive sodium channel n=1 Tax=Taenia crassiceps TaxID=6207 RepID=A0ABR4QF45_9CEST